MPESELKTELETIPFRQQIIDSTPINALRVKTEKILWHHPLGHPCDEYLYNAHKTVDGVPKFANIDKHSVIDQCPTCIQAKQTKTPAGPHSIKAATRPYQGLSIDFSFSGMASKDKARRSDFVGLNGETSWVLVTDHFTGIKHGDTRISKASPIHWLHHFLTTYAPRCNDQYVYMDQGEELFGNPDVRNLFERQGYHIHPTGADASHQNGHVERSHRYVGDAIRAFLSGANLDVKFWPYAFYHHLRISNALGFRGETQSPLELATKK